MFVTKLGERWAQNLFHIYIYMTFFTADVDKTIIRNIDPIGRLIVKCGWTTSSTFLFSPDVMLESVWSKVWNNFIKSFMCMIVSFLLIGLHAKIACYLNSLRKIYQRILKNVIFFCSWKPPQEHKFSSTTSFILLRIFIIICLLVDVLQ
jgi:hypothetical protein